MENKPHEPTAMDCWHFIAPLIPVKKGNQMSMDIYIKTFRAFQLLEAE